MNMPETTALVKRFTKEIRSLDMTPKEQAAFYRMLGERLSLSHHLRPESVAAVMDKPKLPETAPELFAQRVDSREKIIPFLQRVYGSWLGRGFTRNHLSDLDKQAYVAFKNHLYYHGDTGGLNFPTIDEQIDHDFERLTEFDDDASKQELEGEIVALRRIHHFLQSRGKSGD
ncbi:hypothetical protein [Tateyamaria sp.]|uniref:hypothetical protein n=1 Tax=Tateyamaria sp. TaxID=1929288 RepID=UPI00329AA843